MTERERLVEAAGKFVDASPEGTTMGAWEWMADFALQQLAAQKAAVEALLDKVEKANPYSPRNAAYPHLTGRGVTGYQEAIDKLRAALGEANNEG